MTTCGRLALSGDASADTDCTRLAEDTRRQALTQLGAAVPCSRWFGRIRVLGQMARV